jgi:hypothetical protein
MEVITNIPFELDSATLQQHLHIHPGSESAQEFTQLIYQALKIGVPKAIYSEAYVEILNPNGVLLNGIKFTSTMLHDNLSSVERVFPFVVTCGREMDLVDWLDDNLLTQFWWEAIKESLLTSASRYLRAFLERRYFFTKTASMNPGAGDANVWPIEQQRELFALLGDVQGLIGVELTDSFLMIPNKTVSGILFPTERNFRTCQVCHREGCPSRSALFDQELWKSIQ